MSEHENQEEGEGKPSKARPKGKLTAKKAAQVEEYLNDPAKLNRAVASSTTNKRRSPEARAMAQGDPAALKRSIYNILWNKVPEDARQRIAKAICEDWNYCENRSDLADLQSIVYIITSIVSATYIPVCVWVFVVQYKMLDELCGCTDRSMPLNFKKWLQNGGRKVTKKR